MNKSILLTLILAIFSTLKSNAQLTIDAELRPRFEYRHGYKTLFPHNADAASFVSQRTHLNTGFKLKKLGFYISVQDVRVWGDVPQLNTSDKNGLSIHQAWGEIHFVPGFSAKIGRQEIVYDDHRIMGNVGWAQQARSHDMAKIGFHKNSFKTDLGFAFNQSGEALTGHELNVNTYKSLLFAWLHQDWNNIGASILFLHNGLQYLNEDNPNKNETRYSQTIGSHLTYKKENLKIAANLYYQFGNDVSNNNLSAYLIGIEANYQASKMIALVLGGELLSGNKNGAPSNFENKAFTPLYGTNHKFNGFMDYFYVGNHNNSIGLVDLYAKAKIVVHPKANINLAIHNFSGAQALNKESKQLGTEIDLVFSYQFIKEVNIKAGYSQMFASEGLEILKNNFDNNTNNWGWLMVTINPTLFKTEITKTN